MMMLPPPAEIRIQHRALQVVKLYENAVSRVLERVELDAVANDLVKDVEEFPEERVKFRKLYIDVCQLADAYWPADAARAQYHEILRNH